MCQGRASFPRPFSIPGAVVYSVLCTVSYLPTQKHYTGQSAQDWETGISSTQPYPAGRVTSTKTRPLEPKVFQREILRQAVLKKRRASAASVLRCFHGTRRGPHKRNTVCIGAHAPELQARLVESRAASLCARKGRVAKHQQHRHSACRSSRGVAASARGHRAHREAPRRWYVNLFPLEVPERGVEELVQGYPHPVMSMQNLAIVVHGG